jgi:hypothetical protein
MSGSADLNGSATTSHDYILSKDARDELHGQQLPGRPVLEQVVEAEAQAEIEGVGPREQVAMRYALP